jgi:S1-C subfamily serine protease
VCARQARVIGSNQNNDLAVARVDMSGVPPVRPLELGNSTTVQFLPLLERGHHAARH